jgi:RNA polymerase sigma-70 factor, ECF subfamily
LSDLGRSDEPKPAPHGDEQERALLRRIVSRDRRALEALYVIYHRRLARYLTRFVRDKSLIQEITNDTLFSVWQGAARFRGASRVSTWIFGIAHRCALKALRHANPAPLLGISELAADHPMERLDAQEDCARALAILPVEQRLAIELTNYLGHSCKEIAAIMNCPINTVKTRLFLARRRMRAFLQ